MLEPVEPTMLFESLRSCAARPPNFLTGWSEWSLLLAQISSFAGGREYLSNKDGGVCHRTVHFEITAQVANSCTASR